MKVSAIVFACHEKSCAPPPAGKGGSSPSIARHPRHGATRSALRSSDAITAIPRSRGGGSVHTKLEGKKWSVTVSGLDYKVRHKASGRAKSEEEALDRIVEQYLKHG